MAIFNSYVKLPKGMAAPVLTPHPALLHGRVDARRHLRGKGPDLAKLVALISWAVCVLYLCYIDLVDNIPD